MYVFHFLKSLVEHLRTRKVLYFLKYVFKEKQEEKNIGRNVSFPFPEISCRTATHEVNVVFPIAAAPHKTGFPWYCSP